MTTIVIAQLVAPVLLGTVDASLYSPTTPSAAQIGRAVFTNTTASATTITAGITPPGSALGASTTMISARPIAPGESYVSPELAGAVIPAGSQLHVYAGAASAVSFTASGIVST
jgi:hypothetical protein